MKSRLQILLIALLLLAAAVGHAQTHDVQLTATLATTCNAATPCYTEIYRLTATGPTMVCPTTLASYTLIASSLLGSTVTNTGTTTIYDDQDPALTSGKSYCYTATDAYIAFPPPGGESGIGPTALVTFPAPPGAPQGFSAVIKK